MAYGIFGMAGVGKTVALVGLTSDREIRERFPDGILFMTLGQSATVQSVIGELKKIVALTGGTKIGVKIGSCTGLRDAVDFAVPWFKNRVCLFLVDDIWPAKNGKASFLSDFRQILRESPESRMAISARSTTIAQCAGSVVQFGARDALGLVSETMFMAHATRGTSVGTSACAEMRSSVQKILNKVRWIANRFGCHRVSCCVFDSRTR